MVSCQESKVTARAQMAVVTGEWEIKEGASCFDGAFIATYEEKLASCTRRYY
jgi:hypothetical protein